MAKRPLSILASIGAGVVVVPFAAALAAIGLTMLLGGFVIPLAGLLGVGDPVFDHLGSPLTEILYSAILAVAIGSGLAAGVYTALKRD